MPLVSILVNILVSRPDDDRSLAVETSCYRIKLLAKFVLAMIKNVDNTLIVTPTGILHIKRHKTIISNQNQNSFHQQMHPLIKHIVKTYS